MDEVRQAFMTSGHRWEILDGDGMIPSRISRRFVTSQRK